MTLLTLHRRRQVAPLCSSPSSSLAPTGSSLAFLAMITFKHVLFCTSTCAALVASISRDGFVVKHRQGRQLPPSVGDAAASLLSSSMTPSLVTMPVAVATYESSATMSEPSVVSASETALFNASSTTSLTSFASLTTSSAASTRTGSSHSTTAFVDATNAGNVTDTAATAPPDGDLDLTVLNLAFVLEVRWLSQVDTSVGRRY